jgi:hypothetical protein
MPERAIIIPDVSRFTEVVAQLGGAVVQLMPPRIALVRAEQEWPALPEGAFYVDQLECDLLPAEKMFVEASRKRMENKVRPYDGLPWDTPEATPPE